MQLSIGASVLSLFVVAQSSDLAGPSPPRGDSPAYARLSTNQTWQKRFSWPPPQAFGRPQALQAKARPTTPSGVGPSAAVDARAWQDWT